jgi:hypothetical protein
MFRYPMLSKLRDKKLMLLYRTPQDFAKSTKRSGFIFHTTFLTEEPLIGETLKGENPQLNYSQVF